MAVAGDAPFLQEHLHGQRTQSNWRGTRARAPSRDGHRRTGLISIIFGFCSMLALATFRSGSSWASSTVALAARVQTRIAAGFHRRAAADLDSTEAATLLQAAQAATKAPKPKALCPLGRDAVVSAGYAIAEGTFTEGEHAPHAMIPFLVECWADAFLPHQQEDRLTSGFFMNRTRAMAPCSGTTWHGRIDLSINDTRLYVQVPAGPHYNITVNITAAMFRLTSDGKRLTAALSVMP